MKGLSLFNFEIYVIGVWNVERRSLFDVANRRSGVKFFRDVDRCLKLRNRRSGLWVFRGCDQNLMFH